MHSRSGVLPAKVGQEIEAAHQASQTEYGGMITLLSNLARAASWLQLISFSDNN